MTTLATYRKRLQQHLSETKRHAREVERRVKKLGGTSEGITGVVHDAAGVVQEVAAKGAALAQGPVHMVRGTSEQEVLLKNARTEFKEEAEEIANYTAIQKLAESVGDKDTAQLAKAILREEKRMAGFLEKLIPRLTKSVVQAEIPREGAQRRTRAARAAAAASTTSTSARSRDDARSGPSGPAARAAPSARPALAAAPPGRPVAVTERVAPVAQHHRPVELEHAARRRPRSSRDEASRLPRQEPSRAAPPPQLR